LDDPPAGAVPSVEIVQKNWYATPNALAASAHWLGSVRCVLGESHTSSAS